MPSQRVWRVNGEFVERYGVVIATISKQSDGRLTWRGLGMQRINCADEADVLEDVKYFHRIPASHRCPRAILKSGSVVPL